VPLKPDGSEADFFRFVEEYKALIRAHVPGRYDFEYRSRLYMLPVYRHLEEVVAGTPAGGRILDLGCGRGHFAAYLSQRGYRVEGLEVANPRPGDDFLHNQDVSTIVHYPKLWAQAKADYGCDCRYFDGVNLPQADASFDTVLFYASYEHIPVEHIAHMTAESFRVLKSGGRAFIYRCPSAWSWSEHVAKWLKLGHHEKLYGKREILGLLRGAGYQVERFSRSDFFPVHLDPLQGLVNALAKPILAVEAVLKWTPLAYFYHDFVIVVRKP
jgi:SAM-dependent methyltransferase